MDNENIFIATVSSSAIKRESCRLGFDFDDENQGFLMLLELLSKAGAGYYNSHSEELFLKSFNLMRKDRTPNKQGLRFIHKMVYSSSNKKPACFKMMSAHRD